MHGVTGGNWKRSHDRTMATEKNNSTGNCGVLWLCDLLSIKATAPVPDPPQDVLGKLFPGAGESRPHSEVCWWHKNSRCAHGRGLVRPTSTVLRIC
jgi:hypothetical protein